MLYIMLRNMLTEKMMGIDNEDLLTFVTTVFEFTDEEDDALHGFIPMTQELFDSCIVKCAKIGPRAEKVYQKLIAKYPEFWYL